MTSTKGDFLFFFLNTDILTGYPEDTGISSTFWPRIRKIRYLNWESSFQWTVPRGLILFNTWINMYVKWNTKALEQRTGERNYRRALQSYGGRQAIFSRYERNLLSFLWTLDTLKVFAKDRHLSVTRESTWKKLEVSSFRKLKNFFSLFPIALCPVVMSLFCLYNAIAFCHGECSKNDK